MQFFFFFIDENVMLFLKNKKKKFTDHVFEIIQRLVSCKNAKSMS